MIPKLSRTCHPDVSNGAAALPLFASICCQLLMVAATIAAAGTFAPLREPKYTSDEIEAPASRSIQTG